MKSIQVIDGTLNAVYDIFQATDEEFSLIFPHGEDIAFIDEVVARAAAAPTSMRSSQESGSREYQKHGHWASMESCSTSSNTRSSITRHVATKKP